MNISIPVFNKVLKKMFYFYLFIFYLFVFFAFVLGATGHGKRGKTPM